MIHHWLRMLEDFVTYADTNGLDYRLVPAITGVESTFGKLIPVQFL